MALMWNHRGTMFLFGAGVMMTLASAAGATRSAVLLRSGTRTRGEVVQVVDHLRTGDQPGFSEAEGLIRYRAEDGTVHEFWRGGQGNEGNQVTVVYLETYPQFAEIASPRYLWRAPGLVGLLAVPFLLIGGWPMATHWRYRSRCRRLAREGTGVAAVIERVEQKTNVHILGLHPLVFHARFTHPLYGRSEAIASPSVWGIALSGAPRAGDSVRVYLDRAGSKPFLAWDERVDGEV